MSETKWTPGPWTVLGENMDVTGSDGNTSREYVADIYPKNNKPYRGNICHIQSCSHINGVSPEEAAANIAILLGSVKKYFFTAEGIP